MLSHCATVSDCHFSPICHQCGKIGQKAQLTFFATMFKKRQHKADKSGKKAGEKRAGGGYVCYMYLLLHH
jgi:hypothetical protein